MHPKITMGKIQPAMVIPASSIFSSISGESDAGPMVQTILVYRLAGQGC
jgi:hypothetical protein